MGKRRRNKFHDFSPRSNRVFLLCLLPPTPTWMQDLEDAYHITDIHDALALSEVGNDRKLFLLGTQVTEDGSEIPSSMQDAKDLIAQLAADAQ